ncbi:MAG TPA: GNAT family N-acetyltransferase [Anaerolineales bacterium]|nr:GNAT family N-acetyltransferase [Anaerolineales bacterium]
MASFEIRPAAATDLPSLMAIDHSSSSDYVWQLDVRKEDNQVSANFREVRLPRSVKIIYPRDPSKLADDWTKHDVVLVALERDIPVGYVCAVEKHVSAVAWITDLVVAEGVRRRGAASALLSAIQTWGVERGVRRIVLETQSKNHPYIRLAQKFGYEFCGYNDQYYPTQDVALFFGRALK